MLTAVLKFNLYSLPVTYTVCVSYLHNLCSMTFNGDNCISSILNEGNTSLRFLPEVIWILY